MDKDAALPHSLRSKVTSTLLGGEPPRSVISNNKYISPLAAAAHGPDSDADAGRLALDAAVHAALSAGAGAVTLVGPEGSGKTTALEQLLVGWAEGRHLQDFSFVFHFRFRELSSLDGTLSLETLLLRHHHGRLAPGSAARVLQNPEGALFVFDDLDRLERTSDPSAASDPRQPASVSGWVAGLLRGSLLKGAAFVATTREAESRPFPSGAVVRAAGFARPQREAYVTGFFLHDPAAAARATAHMERTLGFYDFCASPGFCWTVCSVYGSLMDAGAELPETLTQLYAQVLVRLIRALRLSEARARALVSALGEMASRCLVGRDSGCTEEEMDSFGFGTFLASVDGFLRVDADRSDGRVFSFRSRLVQEFLSAAAFLWDSAPSEGAQEMLAKLEGRAEFLDVFLAGLSEPRQRRPLEALLGAPDPDRVAGFDRWFRSSSREALKGCDKDRHLRCFHLLLQAQNQSSVREVVDDAARLGVSYGGPSLRDCAALNYVVTRLGGMQRLVLYNTRNLTEAHAETLAPTMRLAREINLNSSCFSPAAARRLSSALSGGLAEELDLSQSRVGDEKFNIFCAGLRNCKLRTLKIRSCALTEASAGALASLLTSGAPQLCVLEVGYNKLGDRGLMELCRALQGPLCKLQELLLDSCDLTAASVEALAAALCSGHSALRRVDLTRNAVGERGLAALSRSLQNPLCELQSLSLSDCELTSSCCLGLSEALASQRCRLRQLDLSVNDLHQEGALLLCRALRRPGCPVEKLSLARCRLTPPVLQELSSLLRGGCSGLTALSVGLNAVGDRGVKHLWDAVAHPSCLLEELDVEMTGLTDACVQDLCGAVRASRTLRRLELRNNALTDAAVPALVLAARDSERLLEMSLRYNDFSEDVFHEMDECQKIRY
ncbi:NACHT, LRR and PYD domains-containing protein 12 [Clinocottus analis]|uniref:NACHT, LRR and PYD domains-containing protein 12 n=1 Tax=Clinocottus analis TaxID=304258 RepID=UPI0035BF1A99